jgi:DNA-binding MarR family transcriptional regulator
MKGGSQMDVSISEEERILLMLKSLSNQLGPKFEKAAHMSLSRFEVLYQLVQNEEINQSALQKSVNIDNAAITRHLKQLEAEGMVTRRKNPCDNRETFVRLTEEGRQRIGGCQSDKASFIHQMFRDFDKRELQQLAKLLERIQYNIHELY